MNINSSNIASVFSAEEGLDNNQQISAADGALAEQFADKFNEKIKQLKALEVANQLPDNFSIDNSQDINELQGFASLFGKALPTSHKLEENIDLENTLETLEDVLIALDGVVSEQTLSSPEDESLIVSGQVAAMNLTAEKLPEHRLINKEIEGKADLLQQEQAFRKPGQDNPVIMAKETELMEDLDFNDIELDDVESRTEKTLPKFATDIANLNRAINTEKRIDLPPMTRHFAHPEWNKEVAEKVIWMHKQAIPSAELRLNPAHLGPITIKIDVTQEQATVAFTVQHAAVKEAIEAALPKLREMFSGQQLNLVDVNVSQDDRSQRQQQDFAGMGDKSNEDEGANSMKDNAENGMDITEEIEAGRAIASNGILSLFA
ncbi:MAG: flagellar hook-length control protein FliK [Methylococcales bacterium]|nr:flagellar hook-length control protein FliK [Methylococcales bacterium]